MLIRVEYLTYRIHALVGSESFASAEYQSDPSFYSLRDSRVRYEKDCNNDGVNSSGHLSMSHLYYDKDDQQQIQSE